MEKFREFILEWDFFSHSSFHRYKEREAYRTLTGGVVSFILVALFVGIFFNMTIDTFRNDIITAEKTLKYEDDPSMTKVTASPNEGFMFALGITGIDLSSSQRYFDISMTHKTTITNTSGRTKQKNQIKLQPCTIEHWSGINDVLAESYYKLQLNKWLCPSLDQVIPLQGKYTSDIFQYAQITISECTIPNTNFPGTTCKTSADVRTFLNNFGQFTFNFYYVNPLLNPQQKEYRTYYLEDRNYFIFDTQIGSLANLFFGDWTISSDQSIFPWQNRNDITGLRTNDIAKEHSYIIGTSKEYFKFYLRKSANTQNIQRQYQKLDQTFSYIGGLFGTIVLLMSILKLYSKYCYELDLGDSLFKQNKTDSFGSSGFNFIVFMGYVIYNVLTKFQTYLGWPFMEKFHKCRKECQKQLNIDFLLKKLNHFEQVSRMLLEEHHQLILLMVPKPTIQEVRLNRKRYYLSNIMQQKNKVCQVISQTDYRHQLDEYIRAQNVQEQSQDFNTMKHLQHSMVKSYAKIQKQGADQQFNKKIKERINFDALAKQLFEFISGDVEQPTDLNLQPNKEQIDLAQEELSGNTFNLDFQDSKPSIIPVKYIQNEFETKKCPRFKVKTAKAIV